MKKTFLVTIKVTAKSEHSLREAMNLKEHIDSGSFARGLESAGKYNEVIATFKEIE